MNQPNYKNGSVVNLMSSISIALGGKPKYGKLKGLNIAELKSKNIVLLNIDGLGYEFVRKYGKNTFFQKYLRGKMTSTFPSTTAAATTALTIGLPPQQHGLTAWFMYLREMGEVATILPFILRRNFEPINKLKFGDVAERGDYFKGITADCHFLRPTDIVDSVCTKYLAFGKKRHGFTTVDGLFVKMEEILKSGRKRKYINAYWSELDSLSHHQGPSSKQTLKHFKELDKKLTKFQKVLWETNSILIITADHGQIETGEDAHKIDIKDHPKLLETLATPLCGEARAAYCYVKASKRSEFEKYVRMKLRNFCTLYESGYFLKNNFYGLYQPHKELKHRVGDYILLMKKNFILRDFLPNEDREFLLGNHGGLSDEEFFVPLIVC